MYFSVPTSVPEAGMGQYNPHEFCGLFLSCLEDWSKVGGGEGEKGMLYVMEEL